jgi:hypothetical protein
MGEAELTTWDYAIVVLSVVISVLVWGAIGAGIARLTMRRRLG